MSDIKPEDEWMMREFAKEIVEIYGWILFILSIACLVAVFFFGLSSYQISQVKIEVKELQERVELLSNGNHLVNNDLYKRISELEEKVKVLEAGK